MRAWGRREKVWMIGERGALILTVWPQVCATLVPWSVVSSRSMVRVSIILLLTQMYA